MQYKIVTNKRENLSNLTSKREHFEKISPAL